MTRHPIAAAAAVAVAAVSLTTSTVRAEAFNFTDRFPVAFTDPAWVGPCDGAVGALTVDAMQTVHLTDTGRTFQFTSVLEGDFTFDPDDPGAVGGSGHFVSHARERVNFGQLKDFRVTDTTHAVFFSDDGTSVPVHVMTTVHYSADGGVEVTFDSIRCGGQPVS